MIFTDAPDATPQRSTAVMSEKHEELSFLIMICLLLSPHEAKDIRF